MVDSADSRPKAVSDTSSVVLGLDIGTTTITCLAWRAVDGEIVVVETVGNHAETTSSEDRQRGYSEWDSEAMIVAACRCVRRVVSRLGPSAERVIGLGLTGQQHGVVIVDDGLAPLTPFVGWRDQRGNEARDSGGQSYVDAMMERLGAGSYDRLGCRPATGYLAATLFWMQRTGQLPADGTACFIVDLCAAMLTGDRLRTDPTNAGASGLLNLAGREWDPQALEQLEIERRWLPEICEAPTVGGRIHERAAAQTGLRRGVPVMVGIGDNQAAFLGSIGDREGAILVNVGTGGQVSRYHQEVIVAPPLETRPFPSSGNLLVHAGLCGGRSYAVLEGFFRDVGRQLLGVDQPAPLYPAMLEWAERVQRGSDGVTCSPFFTGTRSEPQLRASWSGLSPENLSPGHLSRALLEGMAAAFADSGRLIAQTTGRSATRLVGAGNGLRENGLLAALVADAFGLPMLVARYREEAALGAALVAAVGVGLYEDLHAACRAVVDA